MDYSFDEDLQREISEEVKPRFSNSQASRSGGSKVEDVQALENICPAGKKELRACLVCALIKVRWRREVLRPSSE